MSIEDRLKQLSAAEKRNLLARLLRSRATRTGIPSSRHQEQAWLLAKREPDSSRGNLCAANYLLASAAEHLSAAIGEVVSRHEALRTGFASHNGHVSAFMADKVWLQTSVTDLRSVPETGRRELIQKISQEDLLAPFDLSKPPLFRLRRFLLEGDGHLLFLCAHEIVADTWSLWVLLTEITERATAQLEGRSPNVFEAPVPFSELARQRRGSDGNGIRHAYWKTRLEGAPLPVALSRPATGVSEFRSVRGGLHTLSLAPPTVAALSGIASQQGSSLPVTVLATYALWLARKSGVSDVVVGVPGLNRDQPEYQGVIGPLAGYHPVRFKLARESTFRQLSHTATQFLSEAMRGPAPTVAELAARFWPERLKERDPFFRFAFFTQELNVGEKELRDFASWQPAALAARHDLTLAVLVGTQGAVLRVEYAADLYDAATIVSWCEEFQRLLAEIGANPDRRLSSWLDSDTRSAPEAAPRSEAQASGQGQPPSTPAAGSAQREASPPAAPQVASETSASSPAPQTERAQVAPSSPAPTEKSPGTGQKRPETEGRARERSDSGSSVEAADPRGVSDPAATARKASAPGDDVLGEGTLERMLAAVWKEVLEVDSIGAEQNFFDLGGHSLLAMRVHSILIESLGAELPMRLQFEAANLTELAEGILAKVPDREATLRAAQSWLKKGVSELARQFAEEVPSATPGQSAGPPPTANREEPSAHHTEPQPPQAPDSRAASQAQKAPEAEPRLEARPDPGIETASELRAQPQAGPQAPTRTEYLGAPVDSAPVSFAQQRLWFLDQLEPGNAFYNLHFVVELPGYLNQEAMHAALSEIIRRHETLRTTFSTDDRGEPIQVVHEPVEFPLPQDDLRALSKEERKAAVERLVTQEVHTPFDLARGPLFRARLLLMADAEQLLIVAMHHIVVDAWSLGVLMHELQTLYQAFASGQPSPLKPLPMQYKDFARWQRENLQGERLEKLVDFWKGQLAGAPPVLELPADRPRPTLQSFSGAILMFELDPELAQALLEWGRKQRATPFMLLLAAFASLLSRHANQDDVVVGSPIANRPRSELEQVIGFLTNTLVLRVDLSGDPSFTDLVNRVRTVTLDAYDHQDLPFERLVDEIQPERNLSHNPLFQVLFSFDVEPGPDLARLEEQDLPQVHSGTSKFDLGLYMFNTANGLGGAFEYNTDLFDGERIERLMDHLKALLGRVASAPDTPLSELEIVSEEERQQLLSWSRSRPSIAAEACTHELFERQAQFFPDREAVRFNGRSMTFAELDRAGNRLAHLLRSRGIDLDLRVGLSVDRSLDMFVALLGILKSGAAYVPLDPSYPQERISYMLKDAEISIVLTHSWLKDLLPQVEGVDFLCFDELEEELSAQPDNAPQTGVTLDNVVYAIYTSGSTGQPKGVAMTHRAVADLVTWQARQAYFGEGGKTLQFTSLSFDVSFQEIFSTWLVNGSMVGVSEEDRRDPDRLAEIIRKEKVERIFQPFVATQQLCAVLAESDDPPDALRMIISAGEQLQLTPQIVKAFQKMPKCRLYNQYGPSETHIVTEEPVPGVKEGAPALPPIGKALATATSYVLDGRLRPQPVGVPGELYIGGGALARGYLNRPAMTAEKFLPDPFVDEPGARMYKTGDIARISPRGSIEFEGRVDNQVKIRGFRVEPGEIETVLRRHPAVKDSVVVVLPDLGGEKRLVTYFITKNGGELPMQEVREFLRQRLPEYMLPTFVLQIEELPLTPSGKINRRALPDPDFGARQVEHEFVAPRTPTEEALVEIYKEVLTIDEVGIHDSFFELGGHSLLATRLVARVREDYGVNLSVRLIFEAPTVAELSLEVIKLEAEQAGGDFTAELLKDIEQMSKPQTDAVV